MSEQVVVGVQDLHVAKILETGEYDTPVKFSELINLTATPNFSASVLYGDNRAVISETTLGDIDISLNVFDLRDEHYEYLMGAKKNADGVVLDSINDQAPYVAIMYRVPFSGGGFKYITYYKGKFQPPSTNNNTKNGSTEYQTPVVTAKFVTKEDGHWRASLTDKAGDSPIAKTWFDKVYEETEAAE